MRIEIGPGRAGLTEGFHADEGSHRWTDGCGWLPESLPECLFGDRAIEVQLAESRLRYRADLPARARPWPREESVAFDRKPRPKAPRLRRVASPR